MGGGSTGGGSTGGSSTDGGSTGGEEDAPDDLLAQATTPAPTARGRKTRRSRHRKRTKSRPKSSGAQPAPKPKPATKPKPKPASKASPSELLAQARSALGKGRASQAYTLASRSYKARKSSAAAEVMVQAACRSKQTSRAKAALKKVKIGRRPSLRRSCRKLGVKI